MVAGAQISACRCGEDDMLHWKLSSRLGKERQRCTVGVRRAVSKNLRNCWSISICSHLCGFLGQMGQNRENQLLHKTPPTLKWMSYYDSRQRPHRLPLFAVHIQETEAAICTRPPKTRTKMLPVLKNLNLRMNISKVRSRIWYKQHANTEPPCLSSGGVRVMGMVILAKLGLLDTNTCVISTHSQ